MKAGEIWCDNSSEIEVKIVSIKSDNVYYKFNSSNNDLTKETIFDYFGKDYAHELPREYFLRCFYKKR